MTDITYALCSVNHVSTSSSSSSHSNYFSEGKYFKTFEQMQMYPVEQTCS